MANRQRRKGKNCAQRMTVIGSRDRQPERPGVGGSGTAAFSKMIQVENVGSGATGPSTEVAAMTLIRH
jgi:hypothetical protein